MSDLFSIYEDGLNTELNRLSKIIETMSNLSKGKTWFNKDKTEIALNDADANLKEAERIVKIK